MILFNLDLTIPRRGNIDAIMHAYEQTVILYTQIHQPVKIVRLKVDELLSEIMHEHIDERLDYPNLTANSVQIEHMAACLTLMSCNRIEAEIAVATIFSSRGQM